MINDLHLGRSAAGGRLRLFDPTRRPDRSVESFLVELGDAAASAQLPVHVDDASPLALLFEDMAREQRGWSEAKSWCSPAGNLELGATADGRGYANISIRLTSPTWRFECTVPIAASELARAAMEVRSFLYGGGDDA
jgi:hypothetical protein